VIEELLQKQGGEHPTPSYSSIILGTNFNCSLTQFLIKIPDVAVVPVFHSESFGEPFIARPSGLRAATAITHNLGLP